MKKSRNIGFSLLFLQSTSFLLRWLLSFLGPNWRRVSLADHVFTSSSSEISLYYDAISLIFVLARSVAEKFSDFFRRVAWQLILVEECWLYVEDWFASLNRLKELILVEVCLKVSLVEIWKISIGTLYKSFVCEFSVILNFCLFVV